MLSITTFWPVEQVFSILPIDCCCILDLGQTVARAIVRVNIGRTRNSNFRLHVLMWNSGRCWMCLDVHVSWDHLLISGQIGPQRFRVATSSSHQWFEILLVSWNGSGTFTIVCRSRKQHTESTRFRVWRTNQSPLARWIELNWENWQQIWTLQNRTRPGCRDGLGHWSKGKKIGSFDARDTYSEETFL